MAIMVESNTPHTMSCAVLPSARPIMADTSSLVRDDWPQSPRTQVGEPVPPLLHDRLVEAEAHLGIRRSAASPSWPTWSLAQGSKVVRTAQKAMKVAATTTGMEARSRRKE